MANFISHQCPIDMRKLMAENIVVMGGTAMLQGFQHRLLTELKMLLEKPCYKEDLSLTTFKIHQPPSQPNFTAWLGGQSFHISVLLYNLQLHAFSASSVTGSIC